MKKNILLILVLLISRFVSAQDHSIEYCSQGKINFLTRLNKSGNLTYPGDNTIDATYYKLKLQVNHLNGFLSGEAFVDARAVNDKLKSFYLDLSNTITVSSVTSKSNSLTFTQMSDQLRINLEKEYAKGELISVAIKYSGFPQSSGFGSFVFTTHNNQPIVWSLSQPYGAKAWWPSKDTPADKADSCEVWITADKYFTSISNGVLIETLSNSDGTTTYKWKHNHPIANYLISVAMTNYQKYDTPFEYEPGKILPVSQWVFPESFSTNKANLDLIPGMLKIFSEKFGLYPYIKEKYGQAQITGGTSMEHQTVSSMGTFREDVEAHELAHQWFGDWVTCKDWQNIWLNEGFATYSESIYYEAKYGKTSFMNDVINIMGHAKTAKGTIYVQDISTISQIFNGARSYSKGGVVLHMLRGVVGDDNFFKILKEYLKEPGLSYNVATTEDFQKICERVYGKSLDYFFKQWIYGENYPKFNIGWNYKQVDGNNYNLLLRLRQNVNTNPQFFTMPVHIKISTTEGIVQTTVVNDQQEQVWNIPVTGQPYAIAVDPDNWILKDIISVTKLENEGNLPTNFELSQNYPNPFNPGTVISWQIAVGSYVTLKVYDILGRELAILVDEYKQPGNYSSFFTLRSSFPSGVYFYQLKVGDYIETKKMTLLK